ncbi:hypothetical protein FB384_004903 [Prauserella sediminis]|uniref:Uncharacterized protein n=1 Tax=Prauserella sediminis TaxID=577680 RepID=A0A839XX67_9PSEU|nr:hypothetical protein [Prauserella sediminis]MBB3665944.1 hypothetical protein [Prauserella sediminis]
MSCHFSDVHTHYREDPRAAGELSSYVIERHDPTTGARWSIGRVNGFRGDWVALGLGHNAWTPYFPSRDSAVKALLMARGDFRGVFARQPRVPAWHP